MELRIKESGLQRTRGSRVQPCTPIQPPPRAAQSPRGPDSSPALSLGMSLMWASVSTQEQDRNNSSGPSHLAKL